MHVEEVHFVRERAPVEATLLDERYVKAERIGVDRARAHAARRALAADDDAVHAELREARGERRAEKRARAHLGDHHVLGTRLELGPDRVEFPGWLCGRVSPVE